MSEKRVVVTVIDGEIVIGLDQNKLERHLGIG